MTTASDAPFEAIVADYDPALREVAVRARALIAEVHPDAVEVVWPTQGSAGYGVGPRKMSDHYAYLFPHKRHVNLGFTHGATLDDPEGLLEGSGKTLRHVKLRSEEDLERPALRDLLAAAVAERAAAKSG
jgi:hypothetical protein